MPGPQAAAPGKRAPAWLSSLLLWVLTPPGPADSRSRIPRRPLASGSCSPVPHVSRPDPLRCGFLEAAGTSP